MSIDRLAKRAERLEKLLVVVTEGCCSTCAPTTKPRIPWHDVPLEQRIRLDELMDTAERESVTCPSCGRERTVLVPSDEAQALWESILRKLQDRAEAE